MLSGGAALLAEFARTQSGEMAVFEPVSAEYSQCNLAAWKHRQLPPEWLFRMFWHSARDNSVPGNSVSDNYGPDDFVQSSSTPGNPAPEKRKNREALFTEYLATVTACGTGPAPFPGHLVHVSGGVSGGRIRPVHHNEEYRSREEPAYGLSNEYEKLLPVAKSPRFRQAIQEQTVQSHRHRRPGGRRPRPLAAPSRVLAQVIDGDFFLSGTAPAERLAESGGNIHYERFCAEVPVSQGERAFYRRFDCGIMDWRSRLVQSSPWRIVEGSHNCHPAFGIHGCRVISPEEQKEDYKEERPGDGGTSSPGGFRNMLKLNASRKRM